MQLEDIYSIYLEHPVISTDSRSIPEGCLFFALKGENFNGNRFAIDALQKGAAYAVIDETEFATSPNCIPVENVLHTLQELAHHHRKQFTIPFIAICGSNGKTTTKELIHTVLRSHFNTIATKGNLNNHIGVPLTLLSIPKETEIAVIEIGANHIDETAELCEIAAPDYGLVTNNGKDHLEGFGSIEGVRKANGELYEWLTKSGGMAFVNDQHPDLLAQSEGLKRKLYGAAPGSDYTITPVEETLFAAVKTGNPEMVIHSQLAGNFNWENIATAIAIGKYFGVPDEKIKSSIENYQPGMNRSQVMKKGTTTYIVDCYNANPSSMALAIESFASIPGEKKAIILGDMLELGEYSRTEHKGIIDLVKTKSFDRVILVGAYFGELKNEIPNMHFDTSDAARNWFREQDWENWMVLLKGSRGYKLEKIIE